MDRLIARLSVLCAVPAAIILMAACDGPTERESASPSEARLETGNMADGSVPAVLPLVDDGIEPQAHRNRPQDAPDEAQSAADALRAADAALEAASVVLMDTALNGDISPVGEYRLTEPRTGSPLQLELVMTIATRERSTWFVVRVRNVGDGPLDGYFRLVCSTRSGRAGVTIEPKSLRRGRMMHQQLFVDGDPTTEGHCALQQEADWRPLQSN